MTHTAAKNKILVVDDERDVEMLFKQKFRKEIRRGELEMEFAFSGKEALDMLENHEPAEYVYILSDINMPGMSGLELLEQVKERFPGIHVSMISAYGDSDFQEKAMHSGAREFFSKPIDFQTLKHEISPFIAKE